MIDVRQALAEAAQRISRHEAEILLLHVLDKSRSWLIAHDRDVLNDSTMDAFNALVARRVQGEPVAYLIGSWGFWSFELLVTPATLIPRPETELLVELALARLPMDASSPVADLGTGSGAIALAIAHERPQASVIATDQSGAALEVASNNAHRLGLSRVSFVQGDWFVPLAGRRFAVIASNPPYIEAGDVHLTQGDLRFEPAAALSSGSDGLEAIRRIVRDAPDHLDVGGWLLLEHGWHQGPAVRELLNARGFAEVTTVRDLEDRDRVSLGRWT